MVKVYPPFVNYFEMTKETVTRCDRDVPRFHAFLKVKIAIPSNKSVHRLPVLIIQASVKRTTGLIICSMIYLIIYC